MGTTKRRAALRQGASLGDVLFNTTQQRLLALLFGQPDRSYYAKELIRSADVGTGAVQRELARLVESGLVTIRAIGNQKHFQANADSPIFDDLRAITAKTFGMVEPLRMGLAAVASRIQAAFIYGSVAKRADTATSDIDLMVVADKLPYGELAGALEETSATLGRQVNPTIFSSREFSQRARDRKSFVRRVLAQPRIWLIGDESDLPV